MHIHGENKGDEMVEQQLTKTSVYMYAIAVTGRPNAVLPAGTVRSWLMLIPISNKARASHCQYEKKWEKGQQ